MDFSFQMPWARPVLPVVFWTACWWRGTLLFGIEKRRVHSYRWRYHTMRYHGMMMVVFVLSLHLCIPMCTHICVYIYKYICVCIGCIYIIYIYMCVCVCLHIYIYLSFCLSIVFIIQRIIPRSKKIMGM